MSDTSSSATNANQTKAGLGSSSQARPTPLGIYDRPRAEGITGIEIIAIALSVLWLLGASVFFMTTSSGSEGQDGGNRGLMFLMTMLAIFMPVGMIWVAATAAKASRVMREESQRLQAAIDAIRQAYIAQQQGRDNSIEPSVARKLDEIAAAAKKTETTLATSAATQCSRPATRRHPWPRRPPTTSPSWPLAPRQRKPRRPSPARISSAP